MGITKTNLFNDRFKSIQQGMESPEIINANKYSELAQQVLIVPPAPSWDELLMEIESLTSKKGYHIYNNFLNHRVKKLHDDGQGAALMTTIQIAKETATRDQIGMFSTMVSLTAGKWESMTVGTVRKLWAARRHTREVMEKLNIDPKLTKYVLKCAYRLGSKIMACLSMATKEQGKGSSIKLFFWLISPKRLEAPAT